jgi:hypothetical protein
VAVETDRREIFQTGSPGGPGSYRRGSPSKESLAGASSYRQKGGMTMDSMKQKLIETFILPFINGIFVEILSEENYQLYGDKLFDFLERAIADSKTTFDNKLFLPLINQCRIIMDIPDLPD